MNSIVYIFNLIIKDRTIMGMIFNNRLISSECCQMGYSIPLGAETPFTRLDRLVMAGLIKPSLAYEASNVPMYTSVWNWRVNETTCVVHCLMDSKTRHFSERTPRPAYYNPSSTQ